MAAMLEVKNIEVTYSEVILVLKGMSLQVLEGQIVAILGNNGAGKSTTLKAISGLLKSEDGKVTDGSITFMDERIDRMDPEKIVRKGIFQVMEGRKAFEDLTVEENLLVAAHTIKRRKQIRKDLEYYSKRVPDAGTPAMTQAIFALLYARLGEADKAYHWFKEAYEPNLNHPFRVIAETKGGTNPYFATGAGGVLQSVLMGFGGLDITADGIVQAKPLIPANWKKLTISGVGPEGKTFVVTK